MRRKVRCLNLLEKVFWVVFTAIEKPATGLSQLLLEWRGPQKLSFSAWHEWKWTNFFLFRSSPEPSASIANRTLCPWEEKLSESRCPHFFLNWAPRHEGVLGEWRYSCTHSLTSTLDGGEWSVSRAGRFTLRERAPGTNCTRVYPKVSGLSQ
jgi:hypothetical protein